MVSRILPTILFSRFVLPKKYLFIHIHARRNLKKFMKPRMCTPTRLFINHCHLENIQISISLSSRPLRAHIQP